MGAHATLAGHEEPPCPECSKPQPGDLGMGSIEARQMRCPHKRPRAEEDADSTADRVFATRPNRSLPFPARASASGPGREEGAMIPLIVAAALASAPLFPDSLPAEPDPLRTRSVRGMSEAFPGERAQRREQRKAERQRRKAGRKQRRAGR